MIDQVENSRAAEYRAKLDGLIATGAIEGRRYTPRRTSATSSPLAGKGRGIQWICEHVDFAGKKCLFWPLSKNNGHPALVGCGGVVFKPTKLMCWLAHGAPPSKKHQAAHTCGRGNKGCIHPQHLAWKTVSELRFAEFKSGYRRSYGRGGKITPAEAAAVRAMSETKSITEIAKTCPLSPHRIGEILSGKAYKPLGFSPRDGKFYPRFGQAYRSYCLGTFASYKQAGAAYEAARMRVRLGQSIAPSSKEKPSSDDIKRWFQPPTQRVKFGDGEAVVTIDAEQEQSMLVMHNALDRLHPRVQKFVLVASETGDLNEATQSAGLSRGQVAVLLPRLRVYLGSIAH